MGAFVWYGDVSDPSGAYEATWDIHIPPSDIVATATLSQVANLTGGQVKNAAALVWSNVGDDVGPVLAESNVTVVTGFAYVDSGYAEAAFLIITP